MIRDKVITFELTTACGAKCVMCQRDKLKKVTHMSTDSFKEYVLKCKSLKGLISIGFCGFGDPLMATELEKKLQIVRDAFGDKVELSITTTCHMLDEKMLNVVNNYIDVVKISMYGFNKEVYESVHRGSLNGDLVKRNIDRLLHHPNRPYVIMSYLLLDQNNKSDMEIWKKTYGELADEIQIWKPHNFAGYSSQYTDNDYSKQLVSCGRPLVGDYMVHTDGMVSVCCYDYLRDLIVGDLNTQSFDEILNGNKMQRIINKHKCNEFSNLICANCDQTHDRSFALIYNTNKDFKVGMRSPSRKEMVHYKSESEK